MKKKFKFAKLINTVWVTAIGILFLLPLLWMLSSSLKLGQEVFTSGKFQWIPDEPQWVNYVRVWTYEIIPFWKVYVNSLKVSIMGVVGLLIVSSLAAYAFAKINFKGKNLFFAALLTTMMIPGQALLIPRFMLVKAIGLYDNHWSLIVMSWFGVSSVFLLRQFYMGIPSDLIEAAKLDGASHFQIWLRIMQPLTKSVMVTVTVLQFVGAWNEYLNALIFLPSQKNYLISQAIQYWLTMADQEYHYMMAAASSAIIPIIIMYFMMQKYIVEGVAHQGLKG